MTVIITSFIHSFIHFSIHSASTGIQEEELGVSTRRTYLVPSTSAELSLSLFLPVSTCIS